MLVATHAQLAKNASTGCWKPVNAEVKKKGSMYLCYFCLIKVSRLLSFVTSICKERVSVP
jgi:hypothetical protein